MDLMQLIGFVVSMLALLLLSLKQGRERRLQEAAHKGQEERKEEDEDEFEGTPYPKLEHLFKKKGVSSQKSAAHIPSLPLKNTHIPVNRKTTTVKKKEPTGHTHSVENNPYETKRSSKHVPGKVLLKELKSLKEMIILNEIIDKPKWKE